MNYYDNYSDIMERKIKFNTVDAQDLFMIIKDIITLPYKQFVQTKYYNNSYELQLFKKGVFESKQTRIEDLHIPNVKLYISFRMANECEKWLNLPHQSEVIYINDRFYKRVSWKDLGRCKKNNNAKRSGFKSKILDGKYVRHAQYYKDVHDIINPIVKQPLIENLTEIAGKILTEGDKSE